VAKTQINRTLGCKNVSLFLFENAAIDQFPVYQVHWLRAKAHYDRWNEELLILQHEIKWTVLWFKHQMEKWEGRLKRSVEENRPGHVAYAEKQIAMWKQFRKEGEREFKKMIIT
jgi:hypothetical protein